MSLIRLFIQVLRDLFVFICTLQAQLLLKYLIRDKILLQ